MVMTVEKNGRKEPTGDVLTQRFHSNTHTGTKEIINRTMGTVSFFKYH